MGFGGTSSVRNVLFARHAQGPITPAHTAQLEHHVATGDAAASDLLPTSGNRFRLFDDTVAWGDQLATDIQGAQHHFNFTVYAAHPGQPGGPIAEKVIAAAEAKARDGVPVTAILDAVGSGIQFGKRERVQFVERLRDNRIQVAVRRLPLPWRNPLDDAWRGVDHRKIFDIDGRIAHHGGMNLVDEWAPWHDLVMRVEGPAAAQSGAVLAARWRDLGGEVTPGRLETLRAGLASPVDDAAHATRVLTDGNRRRRELTEAFLDVTRATQDRFIMMDPYLSDPRAMEAVVDVARRLGPRAELFLSPKVTTGGQAQDIFTDPLRRAWAYRFAEAGGIVHPMDRFSHAKGWLADDVVGVGSHNKDRSSIRFSYENLVATDDPDAVAQFLAAAAARRDSSLAPTADTVAGWRNLARVRDALNLQY